MCLSYYPSPQHNKRNQHKDTPDYTFFQLILHARVWIQNVVAGILLSLMMGYENHTIHVDDGKAASILPHLICCEGATELTVQKKMEFQRTSILTHCINYALFKIPRLMMKKVLS